MATTKRKPSTRRTAKAKTSAPKQPKAQEVTAMNELFAKSTETAKVLGERNMQLMNSTIQHSMVAGKAIAGSKDVTKALELQTAFAKEVFQAYSKEINEQAKIYTELWRESVKPLQEQASKAVEKFQTAL